MNTWLFPGWLLPCSCSCINPFHCARFSSAEEMNESWQKRLMQRDNEKGCGEWSSTMGLKRIFVNAAISGMLHHEIGILALETISASFKPYLILLIRCWLSTSIGLIIPAAMMAIPWKVSFPSKVQILWSALSAAHWVNKPLSTALTLLSLLPITDCLKQVISDGLIQNPSLNSSCFSHFESNLWSSSIPNPKSKDGI